MTQNKNTSTPIIKFKSTNTSHDILELQYLQIKTIFQYKQQIASLYDFQVYNVKLVFKGKVLNDKQTASSLALKDATVMMVLTKNKKVQKPTLSSSQQAIPKSNLSTGLGSSSPVGFGGYGIMNHPQYMSAISSAVDEQKLQQMMDDPFYQGMIDQMLQDPQTLKQMMQQNPMTKQLMNQNPMMKMIMSNPAMMKMVFNKDTLKMAKQMQKNGGIDKKQLQTAQGLNGMSGLGGLGGLNGLSNFGGLAGLMGSGLNNNANNNPMSGATNPTSGMQGNPFFPMGMMGSGFGNNLNQTGMNQNFPSLFSNPFLSSGLNGVQQNQVNSSSSINNTNINNLNGANQNQNSMTSLFENLRKLQQKAQDETKYHSQIKQLNSMGFGDKQKCVKYLKQCEGDIDRALQKLCIDDDKDTKQSSQNTK